VNQPVAGGDDESPGDIRIGGPYSLGDMGRGLTDPLEIAQRSVVNELLADEMVLIQPGV